MREILRKYSFFILFITFICFFAGGVVFLINRNWIIIQIPIQIFQEKEDFLKIKKNVVLRKKVNLYYWKDEKFNSEKVDMVWFAKKAENLKHLVNNWLSFLQEERIINKNVYLESASLSESEQEVYLSFDQVPFLRDWSTFDKLCFMESLLKTIGNVDLGIRYVIFLVGHQQMEDDHLDFFKPWPIDGYLQDSL